MIIYYTHNFGNKKGESHLLLEKAAGRYLAEFCGSAHSIAEEEASRLVAALTTQGEFGKPVLPGFAPFSISHSKGTWAVLIASGECGLDIQYARKADVCSIAKRFYASEDARAVISSAAGSENGDRAAEEFFRIWARREALIKAAGTSVTDSEVPSVSGSRVWYCGHEYTISDVKMPGCDAFAAVCIRADCSEEQEPVFFKLEDE